MKISLILATLLAAAALPVANAHNHDGHHGHQHHEAEAAPEMRVEDGWARAAMAGRNGAAYGRVVNGTGEADRLIAVKGDIATAVEIHEMTMEDGVMRMRKLEALDVPANGAVELKPGGNHIMLIGLKDALSEGGSLSLTFVFEKAGEVNVDLPIRKAGAHGHDKH